MFDRHERFQDDDDTNGFYQVRKTKEKREKEHWKKIRLIGMRDSRMMMIQMVKWKRKIGQLKKRGLEIPYTPWWRKQDNDINLSRSGREIMKIF